MTVEISNGFCPKCGRGVKVERKGASHIIHFILTILTSGLWLIIWVICGIMGTKWRCLSCGGIAIKDSSLSTNKVDIEGDKIHQDQEHNFENLKKCPYCAEYIKSEAIKCKFCHSEVSLDKRESNDEEKPEWGSELDLAPVDTNKLKLPPLNK
jgi:hypothetical protein